MTKRPLCMVCLVLMLLMCVTDRAGFPLIRGNPVPENVDSWIREHPKVTICGEVTQTTENEFSQSVYLSNTYLIYQPKKNQSKENQPKKISIENVKVFLKKKEERLEKLQNSMIEYHKAAAIIQGHRIFIFRMFVVTLIQRLIHFSITYLVYRAMGLSALGFIDVVALQSVISISVDMLPLPGGMGISEGLFLNIFKKIFVGGLLYPAMLLSRGISYYALVLISAVMTGVAHVTIKRKE